MNRMGDQPVTGAELREALGTTRTELLEKLERALNAQKTEIIDELVEAVRDVPTEILKAFLPFQETSSIRFRAIDAKLSNTDIDSY